DDAIGLPDHAAGAHGEERVVLATADHEAGAKGRAALADDDGARGGGFTVVELDAEVLGIGVAPVLGRALTLFVCHDESPWECGPAGEAVRWGARGYPRITAKSSASGCG